MICIHIELFAAFLCANYKFDMNQYRKLTQESQATALPNSKKTTVDHRLWVAVSSNATDMITGELHETIVGTIGVKRWISNSAVLEGSDTGAAVADRFEIVHFCVDPLQRQQGIGATLLDCALVHCQREGAMTVNLTLLSSFAAVR